MTARAERLAAPAGRLINRDKPVSFTFEGRLYDGYEGDTVASALAANGVAMLSRSFKYHRPRGILTMAGQDANTLVQLPDEPNVLADRLPVSPALRVEGQNYRGSLEKDRLSALNGLSRFLPAGFYYRTFFRPKGAWALWEPLIRYMAGLGKVNLKAPHPYHDKQYLWADVAVIGGGPAGMAAALEAADKGAEVILVDENAILGGSLGYARFEANGVDPSASLNDLVSRVSGHAGITVMTDTTCQACFADNWLPLIRGNRMYKMRAKSVVVATGSMEQPLVFRNNDLPGVMMGSAAQRLIHHYGVRPGQKAVVATANGDGYGVALDLAEAGVEIKAVVDLRKDPDAGQRGAAVERNGIRILPGHTVWEGQAAKGNRGLTGAAIARVTGEGQCDPTGETLDCDMLCMSVGYTPTAHMLYHAGAKLSYDDETAMMAVRELPEHLFVAGSVNNAFDLSAVVAEGRHAGWSAAKDAGLSVDNEPAVPNTRGSLGQTHPWPIFSHPKGKDFVDFDEDLQVKDLKNGIADGYSHVELLKRFTTSGMGPSQGRHSAINTMRMAARATGEAMADVGTTTSRPPYSAETFGQLAGRSFDPIRLTGIHNRHVELGAQMMVAGDWYRPWYYGPPGKARECAEAESMNVHNNVGVIDVSTLGGLEVQGPDAAEMLNRMYTFTYLKQPLNRARYVLMTDQAGVITDDGVAMRIHDEHFYVTATTSGVGAVYQNMLFWNAQWRLRVNVTNVTTSYAGINIAGPKARKVMEILCPDEDLSIEGWPYMDARVCKVAGIESRVMRIGFVGEPGWEIHCPAEMGETMWDALMETGEPFGIKPFGVEAQRLLRLQKGHIIISQDTDGLTHPYEAGMGWAVSKRKPMFIGGRSLEILEKKPLTRQLVGFVLTSKHAPVPEECHLVIHNGQITGRVTSCYYAPILDQVIGLAYVAPEQAADGTIIQIRVGHSMVDAQVRKPQFYDPENKRQEL